MIALSSHHRPASSVTFGLSKHMEFHSSFATWKCKLETFREKTSINGASVGKWTGSRETTGVGPPHLFHGHPEVRI